MKIGMSKKVFTKKRNPEGSFNKYKSRIVFRSDRWYDLYNNKAYAGTFFPDEQYIYMRRPAGLTDLDMPPVIRLLKCQYGQAHVPATVCRHSDEILRSQGFKPTVSDPRLYVQIYDGGTKVYVAVHVDDFGITARTKKCSRIQRWPPSRPSITARRATRAST